MTSYVVVAVIVSVLWLTAIQALTIREIIEQRAGLEKVGCLCHCHPTDVPINLWAHLSTSDVSRSQRQP